MDAILALVANFGHKRGGVETRLDTKIDDLKIDLTNQVSGLEARLRAVEQGGMIIGVISSIASSAGDGGASSVGEGMRTGDLMALQDQLLVSERTVSIMGKFPMYTTKHEAVEMARKTLGDYSKIVKRFHGSPMVTRLTIGWVSSSLMWSFSTASDRPEKPILQGGKRAYRNVWKNKTEMRQGSLTWQTKLAVEAALKVPMENGVIAVLPDLRVDSQGKRFGRSRRGACCTVSHRKRCNDD